MPEKPRYASEYGGDQVELVRATCLYVATKLGDLTDEVVVVGGWSPCCSSTRVSCQLEPPRT